MCVSNKVNFIQILEVHCSEVQNSLVGGQIFSIANGHEYCTALLKTTCCFSRQPTSTDPVSPEESSSGHTTPQTRQESQSSSTQVQTSSSPFSHPPFSSTPSSPHSLSTPARLGPNYRINATSTSSASTVNESRRRELKTNAEVTPDSTTSAQNEDGSGQVNRSSRPPQSQGIPIVGPHNLHRRRSSTKRSSYASNGPGSYNPFGTSEGKYGSFLRSAAFVNSSSCASSNSWSIWNASSIDGGNHMAPGSSLKSWIWVTNPSESDQSGR